MSTQLPTMAEAIASMPYIEHIVGYDDRTADGAMLMKRYAPVFAANTVRMKAPSDFKIIDANLVRPLVRNADGTYTRPYINCAIEMQGLSPQAPDDKFGYVELDNRNYRRVLPFRYELDDDELTRAHALGFYEDKTFDEDLAKALRDQYFTTDVIVQAAYAYILEPKSDEPVPYFVLQGLEAPEKSTAVGRMAGREQGLHALLEQSFDLFEEADRDLTVQTTPSFGSQFGIGADYSKRALYIDRIRAEELGLDTSIDLASDYDVPRDQVSLVDELAAEQTEPEMTEDDKRMMSIVDEVAERNPDLVPDEVDENQIPYDVRDLGLPTDLETPTVMMPQVAEAVDKHYDSMAVPSDELAGDARTLTDEDIRQAEEEASKEEDEKERENQQILEEVVEAQQRDQEHDDMAHAVAHEVGGIDLDEPEVSDVLVEDNKPKSKPKLKATVEAVKKAQQHVAQASTKAKAKAKTADSQSVKAETSESVKAKESVRSEKAKTAKSQTQPALSSEDQAATAMAERLKARRAAKAKQEAKMKQTTPEKDAGPEF